MTFDSCLHIPGKVSVGGRRRVLGQQRHALGDGPARRNWRMDHRHRQLATLDHDFRPPPAPCHTPPATIISKFPGNCAAPEGVQMRHERSRALYLLSFTTETVLNVSTTNCWFSMMWISMVF